MQRKNIEVYTVGFGSANDSILQNIADETGGKYYRAFDAKDIVDIFAEIGYMDDFDMTDTDGDGLPDAVEAAGIRLQNGKILYGCDPTNPDTDGDGLLDGVEIDPKPFYNQKEDNGFLGLDKLFGTNTVQGYYFKMYSNPKKVDSDGDEYNDLDEVRKYNSNPLVNEVNFHRWDNGFISINYSGTEGWKNNIDGSSLSYGGDQGWFFDGSDPKGPLDKLYHSFFDIGYPIQRFGCGLISPSDILLYLALKNTKYSTGDTNLISTDSAGIIDYDTYQTYIGLMNSSWFSIIRYVGVPGTSIAHGINQYDWYYKLGLKAYWNTGKDDLLSKMLQMLDNDIPVTLSIGPMDDGKGISFYDWMPLKNDKYCFAVKSYKHKVNGHYFTVTGIMIDDVKGQTILEISSWGQKYYINFEEYLSLVDSDSNYVYSNMVYIVTSLE